MTDLKINSAISITPSPTYNREKKQNKNYNNNNNNKTIKEKKKETWTNTKTTSRLLLGAVNESREIRITMLAHFMLSLIASLPSYAFVVYISIFLLIVVSLVIKVREPVWPSGKALGWYPSLIAPTVSVDVRQHLKKKKKKKQRWKVIAPCGDQTLAVRHSWQDRLVRKQF